MIAGQTQRGKGSVFPMLFVALLTLSVVTFTRGITVEDIDRDMGLASRESTDLLRAFSHLRGDDSKWKYADQVGKRVRFRRQMDSVQVTTTAEKTKKSKQCLACETAMTAWREKFPCVGLAEPEWTPEVAIELSACPWVTTCAFFHEEEDEGACIEMKEALTSSAAYAETWNAITEAQKTLATKYEEKPPEVMRNNNKIAYFEACKSLGKCSAADETSCMPMLLGDTCRDNPSCPDAKKVNCANRNCYHCYWILNGWFPYFDSPNSADRTLDGYGNCEGVPGGTSFLELQESPVKGIGSPELVDSRGSPSLEDCLDTWQKIAVSAKARYFASYVSQLGSYDWNANTACRCLQMCEYDSYEAFDLYRACTFEASDARVASLFPDLLIEGSEDDGTVRFAGLETAVYKPPEPPVER